MVILLISALFLLQQPGSVQETAPRSNLEAKVLLALSADEPNTRAAAAYLLGMCGDRSHIHSLGALVDDANMNVRFRAISALGMIAARDPRAGDAAGFLAHAAHGGGERCRESAILGLGSCSTDNHVHDLLACLGDASPAIRLAAGMSLTKVGATVDQRDVLVLFETGRDGAVSTGVVHSLDLVTDPSLRRLLDPLLRSRDPWARELTEEAAARLDARKGGAASTWKHPNREKRDKYDRQNNAAAEALQELKWFEVEREAMLAATSQARVLLFGEGHFGGGPLRDAQCELLQAWSRMPTNETFGFEPSVEKQQAKVIDAARKTGVNVVSLEPRWGDVPTYRYADRDDMAAETINARLAVPDHRVFAIRGQSHVLPGGYLVGQLQVQPVVVLYGVNPAVPIQQLGELRWVGRVWRLGESGNVFAVGCFDVLQGIEGANELRKWVATH